MGMQQLTRVHKLRVALYAVLQPCSNGFQTYGGPNALSNGNFEAYDLLNQSHAVAHVAAASLPSGM